MAIFEGSRRYCCFTHCCYRSVSTGWRSCAGIVLETSHPRHGSERAASLTVSRMRFRAIRPGVLTKREDRMRDTATRPYVLGHSETELRRLTLQSAFWDELTEEVLSRAGIGAGMHILDIGSG